MQAAHALTTAAATVDRRVVWLAQKYVQMTCCFVLRHFGVPDVTTGGSQVRCYVLRQTDGQIVTAVPLYTRCVGKDGRAVVAAAATHSSVFSFNNLL